LHVVAALALSWSGCSDGDSDEVCGNGALDIQTEVCDDTEFGTATCVSEGAFDGGRLSCSADCQTIETSNCCADACTTDGETSCTGTVLETCETQVNGCLGFTSYDCVDASQVCDDTGATAVCGDDGGVPAFPADCEYVTDHGTVADGTTDDSAAFETAMAAAMAAGTSLCVPAGTYLLGHTVHVPPGLVVLGEGPDSLLTVAAGVGMMLGDYVRLSYLAFDHAGTSPMAVMLGDWDRGQRTGVTVSHCTFTGDFTWSTMLAWVCNDCLIDSNTLTKSGGVGGSIQFAGGKRNRVTNNVVTGGVTGILFIYSRVVTDGNKASLIENNEVIGNTLSGFSEEGISFDVAGNNTETVASFEYDTIAVVSGSTITLSNHNWPDYVGFDMVFLSGNMESRTRSITNQVGNDFVLDAAVTDAAPGDEVVIGAAFKGNLVQNNTVTAQSAAIMLYGMCFENIVENNVILDGHIIVESTDNIEKSDGNVTGTWGRAPSGYNRVLNNTINNGHVRLVYWGWPEIHGHVNTYSYYRTSGNNVIDNTCAEGVHGNHQFCYLSGNSGGTSFTDVQESTTEMW